MAVGGSSLIKVGYKAFYRACGYQLILSQGIIHQLVPIRGFMEIFLGVSSHNSWNDKV